MILDVWFAWEKDVEVQPPTVTREETCTCLHLVTSFSSWGHAGARWRCTCNMVASLLWPHQWPGCSLLQLPSAHQASGALTCRVGWTPGHRVRGWLWRVSKVGDEDDRPSGPKCPVPSLAQGSLRTGWRWPCLLLHRQGHRLHSSIHRRPGRPWLRNRRWVGLRFPR